MYACGWGNQGHALCRLVVGVIKGMLHVGLWLG